MPSELNRRAVFAALAAFVLALAVAYALSSTGEASEVSGTPGTPAQPLDVASGIAGQTTLGEAEALPALVRKPKPPAKKPESVNTSEPAAPSTPAPSTPTVTPPPPVVNSPPVNSPPSTPSEPPVQFEDSG
jgi:outer membrane biosynthesis protein TonB